jgi:hypothetical protein
MTRRLLLFAIPLVLIAQDRKRERERVRPMAEVTLRLVEASSAASAANDAADLVPSELKTLLRFTRYHLLDSAYVRGTEDEEMSLTLAGNLSGTVKFDVRMREPEVMLEVDVEINGPARSGERAPKLLETTTMAKSGETVVLGASRMRDSTNALIVLLTAKLIP